MPLDRRDSLYLHNINVISFKVFSLDLHATWTLLKIRKTSHLRNWHSIYDYVSPGLHSLTLRSLERSPPDGWSDGPHFSIENYTKAMITTRLPHNSSNHHPVLLLLILLSVHSLKAQQIALTFVIHSAKSPATTISFLIHLQISEQTRKLSFLMVPPGTRHTVMYLSELCAP